MSTLYSDIEVTAKICMDPESMYEAMKEIERISKGANFKHVVVARLLAEMHCLSIDTADKIMRVQQ